MKGPQGSTLLETAIALLLLSVGALAVAAGLAAGERARREAVSGGLALAAAESWLEAWRAGPTGEEAEGEEAIAWGSWRGRLGWRTRILDGCLMEARVEARPATGGVRGAAAAVLVTRRFQPECDG